MNGMMATSDPRVEVPGAVDAVPWVGRYVKTGTPSARPASRAPSGSAGAVAWRGESRGPCGRTQGRGGRARRSARSSDRGESLSGGRGEEWSRRTKAERSKRPQASIRGDAGEAAIGGRSRASIRIRNRAWRGIARAGRSATIPRTTAPEAASRSRPIAPDRAASALVVTSCEQPARAAGGRAIRRRRARGPRRASPARSAPGMWLHADHERGSRRAHSSDRTWAGCRLAFGDGSGHSTLYPGTVPIASVTVGLERIGGAPRPAAIPRTRPASRGDGR